MGSKDRGEVIFHQKIPPLKNMNCMSSNKGHTKKKTTTLRALMLLTNILMKAL